MELTMVAEWLNTAFAGYDLAILSALHELAVLAGWFFTPAFVFVSLFAENGIGFILLSLVLMLFRKTRRAGICMFVAILVGALITNVLVKNFVARPRPFADEAGLFHAWWVFTGATEESSFSFPSGHTTATMAAMFALFLSLKTRARWLCFVPVVLMGLSRNYLMVHYPSDILGGILAGALGALASYFLVQALYRRLGYHADSRLARLVAGFDVRDVFVRKESLR